MSGRIISIVMSDDASNFIRCIIRKQVLSKSGCGSGRISVQIRPGRLWLWLYLKQESPVHLGTTIPFCLNLQLCEMTQLASSHVPSDCLLCCQMSRQSYQSFGDDDELVDSSSGSAVGGVSPADDVAIVDSSGQPSSDVTVITTESRPAVDTLHLQIMWFELLTIGELKRIKTKLVLDFGSGPGRSGKQQIYDSFGVIINQFLIGNQFVLTGN